MQDGNEIKTQKIYKQWFLKSKVYHTVLILMNITNVGSADSKIIYHFRWDNTQIHY